MRKPRKSKKEDNSQLSASIEEDIVSSQVVGNDYPNELAHMHVSVPARDIQCMHTMSSADASCKNSAAIKQNALKVSDTVESIWKCLGLGKIDITHACIGYTHNGNPVLDHEDLVELLSVYGFSVDVVLSFIDDFMECSDTNDGASAIVVYRKNTADIHTYVEPIVSGK